MYKVVLERRSNYQYVALYVCQLIGAAEEPCCEKLWCLSLGQNLHTKGGQKGKEIWPEPPLGVN
jgi:hypothetical protein